MGRSNMENAVLVSGLLCDVADAVSDLSVIVKEQQQQIATMSKFTLELAERIELLEQKVSDAAN